jgi:hypothetical protein
VQRNYCRESAIEESAVEKKTFRSSMDEKSNNDVAAKKQRLDTDTCSQDRSDHAGRIVLPEYRSSVWSYGKSAYIPIADLQHSVDSDTADDTRF